LTVKIHGENLKLNDMTLYLTRSSKV